MPQQIFITRANPYGYSVGSTQTVSDAVALQAQADVSGGGGWGVLSAARSPENVAPAQASVILALAGGAAPSGTVAAPAALNSGNAATYNGATLSLAAGGTLTVDGGAWAALSAGLVILVGQGGTATLAFSGSAVKENSSGTSATSVSLAAAGVYALTPSPTGSPVFRLSGGAAL